MPAQNSGEFTRVGGVRFRVTPKLDGLAGRDDGTVFATRGVMRLFLPACSHS